MSKSTTSRITELGSASTRISQDSVTSVISMVQSIPGILYPGRYFSFSCEFMTDSYTSCSTVQPSTLCPSLHHTRARAVPQLPSPRTPIRAIFASLGGA